MSITLTFLGHDCFRIKAEKVIYFDPFKLGKNEEKADIIFLTHNHFDHTSPDDIKKIEKEETIFVTPLDSYEHHSVRCMRPGEKEEINGVSVEAVPAYNIGKTFHPKQNNWLGFIITINGKRVYHTGDSDVIPEMKSVKADVCLMPVSGVYVMTAEEAASISKIIKPKLAIPMHYGSIIGSDADAELFKELTENAGIHVEILKIGKSILI